MQYTGFIPVRKINGGTANEILFYESVILGLSDKTGLKIHDTDYQPSGDADKVLIVAFGGDGTTMEGIRLSHKTNLPVVGVNLGKVGFLCGIHPPFNVNTVSAADPSFTEAVTYVIHSLASILSGDGVAHFTNRSVSSLNVQVSGKRDVVAVNEVRVEGEKRSLIHVTITLNNRPIVNRAGCLGFIVGTATGSTALSKSFGGAVIDPAITDVVQILPLVPLNGNWSPLILRLTEEDHLTIAVDKQSVILTDGQLHEALVSAAEPITVTLPHAQARLLMPIDRAGTFYQRSTETRNK